MTTAVHHPQRWTLRPLICLLGIHRWSPQPTSSAWRYCRLCGAEQNRSA